MFLRPVQSCAELIGVKFPIVPKAKAVARGDSRYPWMIERNKQEGCKQNANEEQMQIKSLKPKISPNLNSDTMLS